MSNLGKRLALFGTRDHKRTISDPISKLVEKGIFPYGKRSSGVSNLIIHTKFSSTAV